jgi:PAS domain S-box-containing protein
MARRKGFAGLRLSGNTFWLERDEWDEFVDYEESINRVIIDYNMIAACTYPMLKCSARDVLDVVKNHQFALIKSQDEWEIIESIRAESRRQLNYLASFPLMNPNPVFEFTADGSVGFENEAAKKLISELSVKGRRHPLLRGLPKIRKELMRSGAATTQREASDGERTYLQVLLLLDDKTTIRSYLTDITELKRLEYELLEAGKGLEKIVKARTRELAKANRSLENQIMERREIETNTKTLASIVEASDDAIIAKSLNGVITNWNAGAERIYGYSRKEALGRNISMIIPKGHPNELKKFLDQIRSGRKIKHYRTERVTKDGRLISVSISLSPMFDSGNKVTGASSISRDVSAAVAVEKRLQEAAAYNRSLIEASPDPLVTIGPDGAITDANGATEEITGCSRDQLIGTDFSGYFSEPEKARAGYQKVFDEGRVIDYPLKIRGKDGRTIPVLYNASIFKDKDGSVIGVFAAARDITQLKKAEDALRESEVQLRHLSNKLITAQDEARKTLARDLHDSVGQALAAIKIRTQRIMNRIETGGARTADTSFETLLPVIQHAIEEVRRIQFNLHPAIIDDLGIVASINWLVRNFNETFPDVRISKDIKVEEDSMPAELRLVIFRVIQEAISNAGKHSGARNVKISLAAKDQTIELVVSDDGGGFDTRNAFSEAAAKGSLGLMSMRERLQLSGGRLEISSFKAKGTQVTAAWPKRVKVSANA